LLFSSYSCDLHALLASLVLHEASPVFNDTHMPTCTQHSSTSMQMTHTSLIPVRMSYNTWLIPVRMSVTASSDPFVSTKKWNRLRDEHDEMRHARARQQRQQRWSSWLTFARITHVSTVLVAHAFQTPEKPPLAPAHQHVRSSKCPSSHTNPLLRTNTREKMTEMTTRRCAGAGCWGGPYTWVLPLGRTLGGLARDRSSRRRIVPLRGSRTRC